MRRMRRVMHWYIDRRQTVLETKEEDEKKQKEERDEEEEMGKE